MCVGVAWCGVLWLLCREAWDGRGELASQKRKVEDRAAELEALRSVYTYLICLISVSQIRRRE